MYTISLTVYYIKTCPWQYSLYISWWTYDWTLIGSGANGLDIQGCSVSAQSFPPHSHQFPLSPQLPHCCAKWPLCDWLTSWKVSLKSQGIVCSEIKYLNLFRIFSLCRHKIQVYWFTGFQDSIRDICRAGHSFSSRSSPTVSFKTERFTK